MIQMNKPTFVWQ